MNKVFTYILFLGIQHIVNAQTNLVPNPSFEEYNHCPDGLADFGAVKFWNIPSLGSSDYYNQCGHILAGVPLNAYGYQSARTGVAYAGIVTYALDGTYREYLQVELSETLSAGETYRIRFYASLADLCVNSSNGLGACFTSTAIDSINLLGVMPANIFFSSTLNITTNEQWQQIEFVYEAIGNEKYLSIGNFNIDANTQFQIVNPNGDYELEVYYYIDDVSVLKFDFTTPNVFTPNGDGINDYFIIDDIPQEMYITIRIYSRWGNIVYKKSGTNISWDGNDMFFNNPCNSGTYYFVIDIGTNSILNKKGFIQLVR